MKREPSGLLQEHVNDWIMYLAERDKEHHKRLEQLSEEIEDINKKLHILGRSVLKLYKTH